MGERYWSTEEQRWVYEDGPRTGGTACAGTWIEYGKHNNGLWIDARKVASVRNIGKGGSRGSILTLDNGHEYLTSYPATQLVAMVVEARRVEK